MSWPVADLDPIRRLRVLAAAVPDGDRTRFAFLGGVHIPAQRLATPALTAIGRRAAPRAVERFAARVHDLTES